MSIILKDRTTENILDVISLKGMSPKKANDVVREFEKDYIVIRKVKEEER
jgi:hypothetical protein